MLALTEDQVRAALVNATPDERERLSVPLSFVLADWDHLDFLAWTDPDNRSRGYLLVEHDGDATGVVLRAASGARPRAAMCNLCHTMQPGNQVALFTARRAGDAGERGDSVGTYVCADFACSGRARRPLLAHQRSVTGAPDLRIEELRGRVGAFVDRVLGTS